MTLAYSRNRYHWYSWQAASVFAWLIVLVVTAEPMFCRWTCQQTPHPHQRMQTSAETGPALRFVTATPIQAWICLFTDTDGQRDSQQPASTATTLHEHLAIVALLVINLAVARLLILRLPPLQRARYGVSALIDRPPIMLAATRTAPIRNHCS